MALFTDSAVWTAEQLKAQESQILDVASREGIDLAAKLDLAAEEIGAEVLAFLARHSEASKQSLANVVTTAAIRHWHAAHALALVYRDAYHNQLNDRYRGKWQLYAGLATTARTKAFETGVGIVCHPIPKAGGVEISTIAGTQPAATYYVRTSWIDATGAEGCPSEPAAFEAPAAHQLVVRATRPPAMATGWHVYVGVNGGAIARQSPGPIACDAAWTMPQDGVQNGAEPEDGQTPDYLVRLTRILQRG